MERGFESGVKINEQAHLWTAEVRIPLAKLSDAKPKGGERWRLNLYRLTRPTKLSWRGIQRCKDHSRP